MRAIDKAFWTKTCHSTSVDVASGYNTVASAAADLNCLHQYSLRYLCYYRGDKLKNVFDSDKNAIQIIITVSHNFFLISCNWISFTEFNISCPYWGNFEIFVQSLIVLHFLFK